MTMNADKRDSHRVSFRFWAQAQPKNAAGILHNRRACSALQGIGGRATNKQSAKSPTIALLATIKSLRDAPDISYKTYLLQLSCRIQHFQYI